MNKSIATTVLTLVFTAAGMALTNAAQAGLTDETARNLLSMMVSQEKAAQLDGILSASSLEELSPHQRIILKQITAAAKESIGGGRENFP